jgi:hypothetical protein
MPSLVRSARLRVAVSAVAAGLCMALPASSFAQSAPASTAASCAAPVLDLANPSPGDMLLPGTYTIQGLAVDPLAPQGSGIDQVSVFLGNRDQGGFELGSTALRAGTPPDTFSLNVTLPSTEIGEFQVVAYAHSSVTGKETQVSLPIVLGEDPAKVGLTPATATESNTNPGAVPTNCTAALVAPMVTTIEPAPSTAAAVATVPATAGAAPTTETGAASVASEPVSGTATVVGEVASCRSGAEASAPGIAVQAVGTSVAAQTDDQGTFSLTGVPAPGVYTIMASGSGATSDRSYVPVAPGQTIDVGTLDLGAGIYGCGAQGQ